VRLRQSEPSGQAPFFIFAFFIAAVLTDLSFNFFMALENISRPTYTVHVDHIGNQL
jgi:hypothetical protein